MSEEEEKPDIKVLITACENENLAEIFPSLKNCTLEYEEGTEEFLEKFDSIEDGEYCLMVVGDKSGIDFANEVAQISQMMTPSSKTIFVTEEKESLHVETLRKNGFFDVFFLPIDQGRMEEVVSENISKFTSGKVFRRVKAIDISSGTKMDFDTYVYLPLNKKHVPFSKANTEFSEKKAEKLKQHQVSELHVDSNDMDKFYKYTVANLKGSGGEEISATEKTERTEKMVRDLFLNIFGQTEKNDFDSGKEKVAVCQKIISNYISNGETSNWYENLIRAVGGVKGGYSHASDVSTFAALFAIGIEHANPEDVAMAGFFHDLGMAVVPDELLKKPREEWTADEVSLYEGHPERTINMLKEKKMIISQEVEKAILQHHESFNGKGFPKGFQGARISVEAQLLSLADQVQYLMSVEEGKKRCSIEEAVEQIKMNGSIGPEIMNKVIKLLKEK